MFAEAPSLNPDEYFLHPYVNPITVDGVCFPCIPPSSGSGDPIFFELYKPGYKADKVWLTGFVGTEKVVDYSPFSSVLHGDCIKYPLFINPLFGFREQDLFLLKTDPGGGFVSSSIPPFEGPNIALIFSYIIPPYPYYGTTELLKYYPRCYSFNCVVGFYNPSVFSEDTVIKIGNRIVNAVLKRQNYLSNQK